MPRRYKRRYRKRSNLAKRVSRLEMVAKPEKKRYYNVVNNESISDSGTEYTLSNITQGVAENGRIGNEIKVSGVYCKFYLQGNTSYANNTRFILYTPNDPTNSMSSLAFNEHQDDDQFITWKDKFVATSNLGTNARVVTLSKKFKRPMKIKYTSSGGTASRYPIKLFVVSDSTLNTPSINGYMYMYYTDA